MSEPGTPHVTRVLVANRGEIAVRIIRACHELGIEAVAVYSDADAEALHVRCANAAVRLGPERAADSYLDIDRVLDAARESGADAIHPGYGFLSENAAFVERCEAAGLTFVGPSADAMRALGDKASAKVLAAAANVPTVPEWDPGSVPADAFPVLVKATAGGGGRGMRRVERPADLPEALASARREASAGFGDDTLIVEQLLVGARHVEVQLLADAHGSCVYVGDRDCSLQRRHQKVIEEAPAPALSDELRQQMGEAAVRLAQAAGYVNAGTAEFLVDADGRFFFLELNARLQVEHPVTESAFDIDLARWQLRIARGEALTLTQQDVAAQAHSIEARLYAEDPVTFLPTGGELLELELPDAPGVRIDHGLMIGQRVSLAYDPLLAKVIATAPSREAARELLLRALRELVVLGTITNGPLLQHALQLPAFVESRHDIATLEANPLDADDLELPGDVELAARSSLHAAAFDPFALLGAWRIPGSDSGAARLLEPPHARAIERGEDLWISAAGCTWRTSRSSIPAATDAEHGDVDGDHVRLVAPMPGTVIKAIEAGQEVAAGDPVIVLEAMKMENAITAPFDGRVELVGCSVGELVAKGTLLAEVVR